MKKIRFKVRRTNSIIFQIILKKISLNPNLLDRKRLLKCLILIYYRNKDFSENFPEERYNNTVYQQL